MYYHPDVHFNVNLLLWLAVFYICLLLKTDLLNRDKFVDVLFNLILHFSSNKGINSAITDEPFFLIRRYAVVSILMLLLNLKWLCSEIECIKPCFEVNG